MCFMWKDSLSDSTFCIKLCDFTLWTSITFSDWIFLHSSVGQDSACNAGDLGSIPGLGRSPGEGNGNPLQYSCLEDPHGQRSLASPSPWGHRKSDTTERLNQTTSEILSCYCSHGFCQWVSNLL